MDPPLKQAKTSRPVSAMSVSDGKRGLISTLRHPAFADPASLDMAAQVYVGHICPKISDETVQELLRMCGRVVKWMRQPDPITGKWIYFGYCEFASLEGVWRAQELLDGRQLGSKSLVIRCDTKVQNQVDLFVYALRPEVSQNRMIQATVDALLTAANDQWRSMCLSTDALKRPSPVSVESTAQPLKNQLYLSAKYKPSHKELARERRRREAREREEEEYSRLLEEWRDEEKYLKKKKSEDIIEAREKAESKMRLIERDAESPLSRDVDLDEEFRKDEEDRETEKKEIIEFERIRLQEEVIENEKRDRKEKLKIELATKKQDIDKTFKFSLNSLNSQSPQTGLIVPIEQTNVDAQRKIEFDFIYEIASNQVPFDKKEIYSFTLNWKVLNDAQSVNKRFASWIRLKVIDLLGDENPSVVQLILSQLHEGMQLDTLMKVLLPLFDIDAESLAIKIHQLLIFESIRLSHQIAL